MKEGRDVWWKDATDARPKPAALARARKPEAFDAEHPLFVLYTSGLDGEAQGRAPHDAPATSPAPT